MLQSLEIKGLFGIFNYNLQFSVSQDDRIRFITAPNGYGKTSILRFINGLYNREFDVFFSFPFEALHFHIDDVLIRIEQSHSCDAHENVDDDEETVLNIYFGETAQAASYKITHDDLDDHSEDSSVNRLIRQLDLFFASEKCIFVDDRRLLRENTDASELVRFTDVVKSKLRENTEESKKLVDAFSRIVNRCVFSNKKLEIDSSFGFRFVVNDKNQTKLSMTSLSSGEQHILLQTLYLLFEAPTGTLVLIDEPEMSLHLSWQGDYLNNLRDIVSLRQVQCIVSTHSPFIFGSEYSLSVDLFECCNQ